MAPRSRRQLLAGSAAALAGAGSAVAIAACGGSGKAKQVTTVSTVQMQSDAEVLGVLLDMEHLSIAAYGALGARLRCSQAASAQRFLEHERAHVAALERAIRDLGDTPQPARPRAEYDRTFPTLRGPGDALSFALDVEDTAVAAYADAIGKLATLPLRGLVASILTTESQHAAVLLGDLHRPQVPQAFVTGPPPQQDTT
jgi:rubrerythrin